MGEQPAASPGAGPRVEIGLNSEMYMSCKRLRYAGRYGSPDPSVRLGSVRVENGPQPVDLPAVASVVGDTGVRALGA